MRGPAPRGLPGGVRLRRIVNAWSLRPHMRHASAPDRAETATTSSSSKLNRVGRGGLSYDSGLLAHTCSRATPEIVSVPALCVICKVDETCDRSTRCHPRVPIDGWSNPVPRTKSPLLPRPRPEPGPRTKPRRHTAVNPPARNKVQNQVAREHTWYDKAGNRTGLTEPRRLPTPPGAYDTSDQLTAEHRTGTNAYRNTYNGGVFADVRRGSPCGCRAACPGGKTPRRRSRRSAR